MERQHVLCLLLCSTLFLVATSSNSEEEESFDAPDSYWKEREEAMERNVKAYAMNETDDIDIQTRMLVEHYGINSTRRGLFQKYRGPCKSTNPIDDCWRCDVNWEQNRKRLAKCALGFGKGTVGGLEGRIYVVTDSSDNDMVNPKPGTLRHAVIQEEPLWITFSAHMTIRLSQELIMTSHKTIDARGANVVIEGGAGITIQNVENIIIHGLKIRNIVVGNGGMIRDSASHYGLRTRSDGDGISIMKSHHIWIDHVSLSNCADGLIDIIDGSTAITISNCHMVKHNTVFLFGASRSHTQDSIMQVTLAYNHFGKGLVQRMPRCRWGFFHLVNNDYTHWRMYAIGGSENPTILSQGNRFIAQPNAETKEVTHRQNPQSQWDSGTWISENDLLLDGATFTESGGPINTNGFGDKIIQAKPGALAGEMTRFAGPLKCVPRLPC